MKELIVKEYLHLNRKRRHLERRLSKDAEKLNLVNKRISELRLILKVGEIENAKVKAN